MALVTAITFLAALRRISADIGISAISDIVISGDSPMAFKGQEKTSGSVALFLQTPPGGVLRPRPHRAHILIGAVLRPRMTNSPPTIAAAIITDKNGE
jgi:hypothetical protein